MLFEYIEVGIIFSFSLYAIPLLVILVIYFGRDTQDIRIKDSELVSFSSLFPYFSLSYFSIVLF